MAATRMPARVAAIYYMGEHLRFSPVGPSPTSFRRAVGAAFVFRRIALLVGGWPGGSDALLVGVGSL